MRQRVIIAMALACNPSLIIADEPTTALDVIVQNQILHAIGTFQKEMNIGMIFISHDLAVVADVCTHIGVMHAGSLVEYGRGMRCWTVRDTPTRGSGEFCLTLSDEPADLSDLTCPTGTNGLPQRSGVRFKPCARICHCRLSAMNRPIGWRCQPPTGCAVRMRGSRHKINMKYRLVQCPDPFDDRCDQNVRFESKFPFW
jgi:energy-coupling factor transporter ATP-binding protein EcfA2